MMEINHKIKTEEAWKRLYTRFEEENLLEKTNLRSSVRPMLRWKWGLSAAAVVSGIVILFSLWVLPNREGEVKNVVIQENKELVTLVKTLEDGSLVYLAQESSIEYPEHFAADQRKVNLQGEAFFDVAKKKEQAFLIETEKARVEVLGTAFDVRSNKKVPFSLSVRRGKVKVSLKEGTQSILVRAGEKVVLQNGELHLSKSLSPGYFDRYTKRIRFKDESLKNVLRVINMESSDGQIMTNSPALDKKLLTVELSDHSPESVAELICWTFNLKCIRQGNNLILSE